MNNSVLLTDVAKDPDDMNVEELGVSLYNLAHNEENGVKYPASYVYKLLRKASHVLMFMEESKVMDSVADDVCDLTSNPCKEIHLSSEEHCALLAEMERAVESSSHEYAAELHLEDVLTPRTPPYQTLYDKS